MTWPTLSIRSTVLGAILVGLVLPAIIVVVLTPGFEREEREAEVQSNRDALMALGVAVVADPAWTFSASGLQAAIAQIMQNPTVCAVEVLDLPHNQDRNPFRSDLCPRELRVSLRELAVPHDGKTVARLQVAFDDTVIDRQVDETIKVTVAMAMAQTLLGVAVLMLVLSTRLLRPIDELKKQAGRLAAREPLPRLRWSRADELGELGHHLDVVHGQIRDLIGELEGKNTQLHQMAMYDHLTGLPNRTLLREIFSHEAATARRDGATLALMFLDLDQFKAINDAHGHGVGDELLIEMGRRMRATLRESDIVCRMGGDEFLILLSQVDDWDRVASTAGRLLLAVEAPLQPDGVGEALRVRASIGIAIYPSDGADFDALVRAADLAMYRSKDLGRARYSFYHADLDTTFRARLELERELADAIDQGQLLLHYQPVVDARDGRTVACEALVRWSHPKRGLLAPAAFVPEAEANGLIVPLGLWVLDTACAQLAAWKAAGRPAPRMAINVSAKQLGEKDFPEVVRLTMQRHGIAPGELELELTESAMLAEGAGDSALETVARLRGTGAALALDDFGTGYSSLSYLKQLKPDTLKIDRSFVRDLPGNHDDCALAQAIVGMARALSITVLAEGVETAEQRDWLLAQGCAVQQGYLWDRPLTAAEFESRLALASA